MWFRRRKPDVPRSYIGIFSAEETAEFKREAVARGVPVETVVMEEVRRRGSALNEENPDSP